MRLWLCGPNREYRQRPEADIENHAEVALNSLVAGAVTEDLMVGCRALLGWSQVVYKRDGADSLKGAPPQTPP